MQVIVLRKVRTAVVQVFLRVPLIWVQSDVFCWSAVNRCSSRPLKIVCKTGASGRRDTSIFFGKPAAGKKSVQGLPLGKARRRLA